jgi:hypothetical protein
MAMAMASWNAFDLVGWRALDPPPSMMARAADSGIELAWPEVPGAAGYMIYRYERVTPEQEFARYRQGKDLRLGIPETETLVARNLTEPVFADRSAEPGKRYVYRVRAATRHSRSRLAALRVPWRVTVQLPTTPAVFRTYRLTF